MLLPSSNVMNSIFGESLFDDFFEDFARPMRTASRYNTSTGIMRTDVRRRIMAMSWISIFRDARRRM